jgi:hypothetical protein
LARYLAIGDLPALSEDEFRNALNAHKKWRIDRQSWVIKAYWNREDGKLVVECETPDKARFEEWLQKAGWQMNEIHRVNLIHEGGVIWSV